MKVLFDKDADVLYVRREGVTIKTSRECPNDPELVLHYDKDDQVIGCILIGLGVLPQEEWERHPDRGLLPKDLQDVISERLEALGEPAERVPSEVRVPG